MRRLLVVVVALALTAPAAAQDFSSIGSQYVDYGASMMAVGQLNNVLDGTAQRLRAATPTKVADTRYRLAGSVGSGS